MTSTRPLLTALACILLPSAFAPAAWAVETSADLDDFNELLSVMSEETDIATRTKMNSDFVPGIVTVLEGDKLAAMGARSVADALSFIPGVQGLRDSRGTATTIVRGVQFPFNNGNIRIMLNGEPVSRDSAGISGSALDFPIAQVERIEFVRGPGSVVYGEFAFQGLLNIIPRAQGSAVTLEADDRGAQGLHLRSEQRAGDWQFSANMSGQQDDEAPVPVSQRASDKHQFGILTARGQGFTFGLQGIEREQTDLIPAPPPLVYDEDSWSGNAAYEQAVNNDIDLRVHTQYLFNEFTQGDRYFRGSQWRSGAELLWRGWSRQSVLAGVEYSDGVMDRATYAPLPPPPPAPPPALQSVGKQVRDVLGIYVQDQVELSSSTQFTMGARWDDNSETGERITPRAAIAWRPADRHVLKVQYAEGFRSPTFFELYTDPAVPSLDFEVNATTELNYVYQEPGLTARATLFHSEIRDMVFRDIAANVFANVGRADSDGIELEWSQQATATLRVDLNASFADARDNRTPTLADRDLGSSADWMTNAGLLWTPQHDTLIGLHWSHVGPRDSLTGGASEYDLVDVAITRRNLVMRGLDLQLGASNAFDERIFVLEARPSGDVPVRFDPGSVWVALGWRMP